jgi:hypothetical protein
VEIYDALKLAIDELARAGQMFAPEYRLTASRVDGDWVFWFVFLPEAFGRDVTVIVDERGKARTSVGF